MSRRHFIVPVFIPHAGCPHRCAFCNQSAVTGSTQPTPTPAVLREQAAAFLKFRGRRREGAQIAFFGGNFLGLAPDTMAELLAEASKVVVLTGAGSEGLTAMSATLKEGLAMPHSVAWSVL
jgi:histone acetyltransferase (RNA polymerase elongator complex component)